MKNIEIYINTLAIILIALYQLLHKSRFKAIAYMIDALRDELCKDCKNNINNQEKKELEDDTIIYEKGE